MIWNAPNTLTVLRLVLIPLFVVAYYLPFRWANETAAIIFIVAAVTDWLDGYLARRLEQSSAFGEFLDPVADKLMVVAALVMLVADTEILRAVFDARVFAVLVLIIIGREITVSALREWMAEIGKRSRVAVSFVGKIKTTAQMFAIPFLLWWDAGWDIAMLRTGELLLAVAAALTFWSMLIYLKITWAYLMQPDGGRGSPR
jgi:CDP-diacylglycerol---glycerol-3-phosphate 3-phosphatidyltransferase